MSSAKRRNAGSADRRANTGKKRGRTPTREGQAAAAKSAEAIRGATPGRMQEHLADRERRGMIVVFPDESDLSPDDLHDEDELDGELDLGDEDSEPIEALDGQTEAALDVSTYPTEPLSIDIQEGEPGQFEIRVTQCGGKWVCKFPRPIWMRGVADTDDAENDFNQLTVRLALFESLADWLTAKRQALLERPEPMALAVDALVELYGGRPSVVPSEFLRLSGIGDILIEAGANTEKAGGTASYFSRLSSATDLVWADGRMPLDFLFSREARMAWVATAVTQFIERELKQPFDPRLLPDEEPRIPKDKTERERQAAMHTSSLTLPEFITRCCQMAGKIAWSEVLATHFSQNA